jgi:hypothetical protein
MHVPRASLPGPCRVPPFNGNISTSIFSGSKSSAMVEGLEVVIKYKGAKHKQVASLTLSHSAETAILKKDLAHLRVHAPSQKNVKRVGGSFILQWPTAGTSHKPDEVPVRDITKTPRSIHPNFLRPCLVCVSVKGLAVYSMVKTMQR